MLQSDNERLPIFQNTLEVKNIREGKAGRLKAPSGSPKQTEVTEKSLPYFFCIRFELSTFGTVQE